jgi:hypothetical protein
MIMGRRWDSHGHGKITLSSLYNQTVVRQTFLTDLNEYHDPPLPSMIVSNRLNLHINNFYIAQIVIPYGGWMRWSGQCMRSKTGVDKNETWTVTERELMGRWRDVDGWTSTDTVVLLTEFGSLIDGEGNVVGWDVDRKRWKAISFRIFLQ